MNLLIPQAHTKAIPIEDWSLLKYGIYRQVSGRSQTTPSVIKSARSALKGIEPNHLKLGKIQAREFNVCRDAFPAAVVQLGLKQNGSGRCNRQQEEISLRAGGVSQVCELRLAASLSGRFARSEFASRAYPPSAPDSFDCILGG